MEYPDDGYTDADVLEELYWERGLSYAEIGEIFDIAPSTLYYHMDKHDMPTRYSDKADRVEVFHRYYEVDDETGCWEWTNRLNEWGYGRYVVDGKPYPAHRWAYIQFVGDIDDDLYVCHRCHNPSCVNPDHLYAGTPKDNTNDAMEIDAWGENRPRGSKVGTSKLTEDQVREIKRRCRDGETQKDVAEDYPVSHSMVNKIMVGEQWTHVE